jgi:endonuclease YncB( thermonuclease family)
MYPEKSRKRWSLREARLRPPCIYSRAFDLSYGSNVNHTLVKEGWCWWYRKYVPGGTVLEELEKEAREGRKSLWADPQLVLPWGWRKRK